MRLYRVIPYDASAAPGERGGALFVPHSTENRIDNPELYDVLYLAETPEAAIAETFGRLPIWRPQTFVHASGHRMALLTYELGDNAKVVDLDDVDTLKSLGITQPTSVVTRDRAKTQGWARAIFERGGCAGVRWWSYYSPDWGIVGLWDRTKLVPAGDPEPLTAERRVVKDAAVAIVRQITS